MSSSNRIRKSLFIILIIFIFLFVAYSEKWVGQAATYQLIEGSKTASGDVFDKEGLYAACNGFKLGSKVTIVNAKTGKSIVVTINDRINEDSKYFILLTPKASKEIDFEWDTGLVVVNADFSDINSTERIAINGLVREGEIDLETIKQFPEIKWPEDKGTVNGKIVEKREEQAEPEIKEEETPSSKDKIALMDEDEKNGFFEEKKAEKAEEKNVPSEERYLTPESKMREYMMSEDIDDEAAPKEDQQIAMIPEEKGNKDVMDYDKEDMPVERKEDTLLPKEEKIVKKSEFEEKKEVKEEAKIVWADVLQKEKLYVRFFTSFNKSEGENKLAIFQKVFPNLIGVREDGKYILFVGPLDKKDIDINLRNIRSYGFRDAYIVNIK